MHPQYAICLWKYSLGSPRLIYVLRTTPTANHLAELLNYDEGSKNLLGEVINVDFGSASWIRASLPLKFGGIGIRRLEDLARSATHLP